MFLQQASQYWEHLVNSLGEKLEYGKCVFHVISRILNEDGTTTMDTRDVPGLGGTPHTLL